MEPGIGSREERRLMRQRGAGNRELSNIDFGFAFATPVQFSTRKSRQTSGTPTIATRASIRGTNSARVRRSSATQSANTHRASASVAQDPKATSASHPQRKRRRLSDISNISRSTNQSLLAVPEDNDLEGLDRNKSRNVSSNSLNAQAQRYDHPHQTVSSSPLFFPNTHQESASTDKENEPVRNVTKKRKRKSIGQQNLFNKKKIPSTSTVSSRDTSTIEKTEQPHLQVRRHNSSSFNGILASPSPDIEELSPVLPSVTKSHQALPTEIPQQPRRRKKRKSIVGPKKKRKSGDGVPQTIQKVSLSVGAQQDQESVSTIGHTHAPDPKSYRQPQAGRNDLLQRAPSLSRSEPAATPRASGRDEEDADETYLPEEETPEPTPASKRIRGRGGARQKPHSQNGTTRTQTRRRSGKFPILTHRMANVRALPTITEDVALNTSRDEDEEEEIDELVGDAPAIVIKTTPNAVDVLAQACRETIDASVQGLNHLSSADRSRQIVAMQNFRSNLDVRLFDVSQSLDQRLHLEARLRKQRREKAELESRWLEVRKQRDLMALRMDAARRQHWNNEDISRQAWDVSQSAHQLETAMSRAEDQTHQDNEASLLEFSLKELSHIVSSKDNGGILNVLKQFNVQLERVARVAS